jgi:hypothetical protein
MKKMVEDKKDFMIKARKQVNSNLPAWCVALRRIAEGVHILAFRSEFSG